jgi:drug/metabolite transporter (DMT)-like permease
VLHAIWNAMAKQFDDRFFGFACIGVASSLGGVAVLLATGFPAPAALWYVAVSAVIHVGYEVGLMNSYRLGAFNQTYPIARGTSPLVVSVGAWWLAGEHLSLPAWLGIVTLAVGLISLAFSGGHLGREELPAVVAALLTGLTIAAYTLVDGLGVRHSHDPYAYAALLFALQGPVFPVAALVRRPLASWRQWRVVRTGLLAGVLSLLAYGAVLWAQTKAPLGEVAALRETSVIAGAVIGAVLLKERFGVRRLAAAVLVAAGILLISA